MTRPSKIHKILTEARSLIADPERWTQFKGAIDARGFAVDPTDPDAYCWCASGAIEKASGGMVHHASRLLLGACSRRMQEACVDIFPHEPSYITVNDHGTHADILKVFDRAIEMEARRAG